MTEPVAGRPPQEDLFATTEEVRASEFDDVPAELLEAVLRAEETNLDSRTSASREVSRAIESWLASHPADDAEEPDADGDAATEELTP